jgi:hypothetical protein
MDHFRGLEDTYVIIGGTACDLHLISAGLRFRITKDLDVVLLLGQDTDEFASRLWQFVSEGRYERRNRKDDKPQFYRFSHPRVEGYPAMIELLGRTPLSLPPDRTIARFPTEEDISDLSMILLDEPYYDLILGARQAIDGVPLITAGALLLLKAKAFLALSERRDTGTGKGHSRDILKHRNDVFRLFRLLRPAERIELPESIRSDLARFLARFPVGAREWPDIHRAVADPDLPSPESILGHMRMVFGL